MGPCALANFAYFGFRHAASPAGPVFPLAVGVERREDDVGARAQRRAREAQGVRELGAAAQTGLASHAPTRLRFSAFLRAHYVT